MARRRSHKNRDLPPNLQPRNGGYFCYRDPCTGKEYGLGRHRQEAITQAIAANMAIYGSSKQSPLVDRINGTQVTTVSEWTERYLTVLKGRKLKPKTMSEYNKYLKAVNAHLGEFVLQKVETKDIASFLNQWVKARKVTMANRIRTLLLDLFREAIADGLLKSNPAEVTRNQRVEIQRERITLDEWRLIREAADTLPAWIGSCLDLALVTGQRLGDIRALRWEDFKDGRLYIKQAKTGMMLEFSQTTRIDCLNLCLADVLNQFSELNNGVAHIVADAKHQQFSAKTISAAFLKARRISPFWLLPFIALLIAGWLLYTNQQERGTTVTIDFISADGIVAGRTPVRYQGVEIGTVQNISLSEDLRTIQVEASIKSDMKEALRSGTQFWLVTPKTSLAGVSGLDALVGGNYIGMMPGPGEPQAHFSALDTQPKYRVNSGELLVHLHADDLGALNAGSLVYYRKIPVGKVYDYTVTPDNKGVTVDVLIERRFTHLIKKESSFWNVSGIKADISPGGAKVEMQSLAALVNGAVAFDSPEGSDNASAEQAYRLYPNLAQSQRGVAITLTLPSANMLKAGQTPLLYQGLEVGSVQKLVLDPGNGNVTGQLIIAPSVVPLMREGTRIELTKPRLTLNDLNLSRLLIGPTLTLIPGDGEPRQIFPLIDGTQALRPDTLTVQLSAAQSYGIDVGQPVLLHGVQIGQIIQRTLTEKGVTFDASIEPEYRALLHKDSTFIVNSRLNVKLGLEGVQMIGASPQEWLSGGVMVLPGTQGEPQARYTLFSDRDNAQEGIKGSTPSPTLTLVTESLPDIQESSVVLYRGFVE